ncbi:MAG: FAD-binding oxidoreductase [Rhodobacter sp.]|nr:FAD-binding oxidoreductase [Rhodobacter sp.]
MSSDAALSGQKITVLGAGMVGVCTALELQRRGAVVTLVDRGAPGQETSFGNAGVMARSSLIPMNNPSMLAALPRMLRNKSAALRYDPLFLARNAVWVAQFLANARRSRFLETATALDQLIRLSIDRHLHLLAEHGLNGHLSDRGWVFLYRQLAGFESGAANRAVMADHDVPTEILDQSALRDLEPGLAPIFPKALWVKGSYTVNNPGAVVSGYAQAFARMGGTIVQEQAVTITEAEDQVTLHLTDAPEIVSDQIAICLGPWAKPFLEASGFRVRMGFERGYHRHFTGNRDDGKAPQLGRPVYDTAGGYVLSPMQAGLRLSTGVELADCEAPRNTRQIEQAEQAARQAIDLGARTDDTTWLGRRPTFPDSRPAIGMAPGSRRVALGIGHQHIGFTTGAGTAVMLAEIMSGRPCPIDAAPFRTDRYIRRK